MGETFWEPLVELYVIIDGEPVTDQEENQGVFCLCSRAIMCNPVHQPLERTDYENDSIEESSSDEILDNVSYSASLSPSKDKLKGDSEEPGSCYGSGSTDEPDSFGVRNGSDSGADFVETLGPKQAARWEKHWADHGPQIVWDSWREKYAGYMDPTAGQYPGTSEPNEPPGVANSESEQASSERGFDRIEDGIKSLAVDSDKDRGSPVSSDLDLEQTGSSIEFGLEQTGSSNVSSEDSMTDVTRLSATSAELSLTSDSREDENAAAWQVEWDRHWAEQYAAAYLAFARSLEGQDQVQGVLVEDQATLEGPDGQDEAKEIPEEAKEITEEAKEITEEAQEVAVEAIGVPVGAKEDLVKGRDVPAEGQEVPKDLEDLTQGNLHTEADCDVTATGGTEKETVVPKATMSAPGNAGNKSSYSNLTPLAYQPLDSMDLWRNPVVRAVPSFGRHQELSVANSVGFLLRSLTHQSQPLDAEGGGGNTEKSVVNEAPANQGSGGGANATTSVNHSSTNGSALGSGDEPPEQRPIKAGKRPHEEETDGEGNRPIVEEQGQGNVDRALALLGLPLATPPLEGDAHFLKRVAAIRGQNRRLRFGHKQPRLVGNRGDDESSDGEITGQDPNEEMAVDREQEIHNAETELVEMESEAFAEAIIEKRREIEAEDQAESEAFAEAIMEKRREVEAEDQAESEAFAEAIREKRSEMEAEDQAESETFAEAVVEERNCPMEADCSDAADFPLLVTREIARSRDPAINIPAPPAFEPRTQRKRNQRKRGVPAEVRANPALRKFWHRRFQLFSRFNQGIRLDAESWYSVTPEKVAIHLAERCQCDLIVDAFCGAGGNAIQFAFTCQRVIAVDIDPVKLTLARQNAAVYGVADRIDFVLADFTRLAPSLRADAVFLSPPWGGTGYLTDKPYSLERVLPPLGGAELFRLARLVSENVAYYLPRNTETRQVVSLGGPGSQCEIEQSFLDRQHVAITAYYGDLVHSE